MSTAAATRRHTTIRHFTAMAGALFLGVASLALTPSASAVGPVTWYVDGTTGDASYDCLADVPDGNGAGPCLTIGAALLKAQDGDSISIAAKATPYAERLTLTKRVDLLGDPAGGTVVAYTGNAGPVITIATTGTLTDPLTIADLAVTGATAIDNTGSGILVASSTMDQTDLTFDTVTATGNGGHGIAFNTSGGHGIARVAIIDSTLSGNTGSGIRVASGITSINGLSVTGSTIAQNGKFGFEMNPSASAQTVTGLVMTNDTFTGNSKTGTANLHDVAILGFSGDLTMTNVTITAANGPSTTHKAYGLVIAGRNTSPLPVAGTITLTNVTVNGTVGKAAMFIYQYRDVSAITMSGVDLSGTVAPWGQLITQNASTATLDIGDTTLKTIVDWSSGGIDATDATFTSVADPYPTLDRTVAADAYQIADQIRDGVDTSGLGLVRFLTDKVVTTPNSSSNPGVVLAHLQYAQDLATATDTVMAKPGAYYEGVVDDPGTQFTSTLVLSDTTVANPLFVLSGTLSGNGTVTGPLGIGRDADLSPGNSPGTIASGDYTQAGDYLVDVVSGTGAGYPTAGTDYDQLVVTGTVTLESTATLVVTFSGAAITAPAAFVIISNDGNDAVVGTFAGLPEGSLVTWGSQPLVLSYAGGDGNDVTLSLLAQGEVVLTANTTQVYGTTQTLSATRGLPNVPITYAVTAGASLCTLSGTDHNVLSLTSGTGTCTVTATSPATGAYLASSDSVTITAQRRDITVTADDVTIWYGAAAPAPYTHQVTGTFVPGETFTSAPACTAPYTAGDPAGTYTIHCTATADADKYAVTTVDGHLVVKPAYLPTTAVGYTGGNIYQTKSTTSTSVTVPLEAQVDVSSVPGAAAVHDALVTFRDRDTGKILAKDVPVAANGSDTNGIAVAWVTLSTGPYGMGTYTIEVIVTNSFIGDNAAQVQSAKEVDVALPASGAGTVTGLGLTVPADGATPAGAYVTGAYDGTYLSFYFQAGSTTKKASSPKGQLTASWRGLEGWTYYLKSNAVTTVGFDSNHTTATIAFKASLWRTKGADVISLDGNVVGKLVVTEGTNLVGLTAQSSKSSQLYLSTNWVKPAKTYFTDPITTLPGTGIQPVVN